MPLPVCAKMLRFRDIRTRGSGARESGERYAAEDEHPVQDGEQEHVSANRREGSQPDTLDTRTPASHFAEDVRNANQRPNAKHRRPEGVREPEEEALVRAKPAELFGWVGMPEQQRAHRTHVEGDSLELDLLLANLHAGARNV